MCVQRMSPCGWSARCLCALRRFSDGVVVTDAREQELARARRAYELRDSDAALQDYWAPDNPGAEAIRRARDRAVERVLRDAGIGSLAGWKVVDFGCGRGDVLAQLVSLGVSEPDAFGIDISEGRISAAERRLPRAAFVVGPADATGLPEASRDLALQSTLFSSVLDAEVRRLIAGEMDRVLKPGGRVLWVDLRPPTRSLRFVFFVKRLVWWLVKGVREGRPFPKDLGSLAYHSLASVRGLFPGYELAERRTACLSRDVVEVRGPVTAAIARALEAYPPLRVSVVALLTKPNPA